LVTPISVQHQLGFGPLGSEVAVGLKWRVAGERNRNYSRLRGQPTCAGQTVFGRVDGIAAALTGEVGQEKVHGRLADRGVLVKSLKEISRAQDFQNILLHGHVSS